LLGDGKLFGADGELKKRNDTFYDILEIIRNEEAGILHFIIDPNAGIVSITNESGGEKIDIDMSDFSDEARYLLDRIQASGNASFTVERTSEFMDGILCKKLKAPSADKSDITIKVHDSNTYIEPTLGFSIKSRLGKPSTLLNPGQTTNFIYEISGKFSDNDMEVVNDMYVVKPDKREIKLTARMIYLLDDGIDLKYVGMQDNTFHNNLILIDSALPEIVAYMLVEKYRESDKGFILWDRRFNV
jgi:hypothetical protein